MLTLLQPVVAATGFCVMAEPRLNPVLIPHAPFSERCENCAMSATCVQKV